MGNANTVSNQLTIAGFDDISFHRSDKPITAGSGVQEAIDLVTSIGPAGEILRLAGEKADPFRPHRLGARRVAEKESLRARPSRLPSEYPMRGLA